MSCCVEKVAQGTGVLFSQELGRGHKSHLMAGIQGHQHRQSSDCRLSGTDIALNQARHRCAATEVILDFRKHTLLCASQREWQELPNPPRIHHRSVDPRCLEGAARSLARPHGAREGQQLVESESKMVLTATIIESFQRFFPALVTLGHGRHMQFAQGVVECRKVEPPSDGLAKGISARVCDRKTLFDDAPQTTPSETPEPPVHRHDPRGLVRGLLDLWIDELERAPSRLAHLTVEIDLGFVGESRVDPPVIEPHDLEVSPTVVNETIDDHHSPSRNPAQSHALDDPTEEHPRA